MGTQAHVVVVRDASKARLEAFFGNNETHKGKVYNLIKRGLSDVFIYVSGHGVPGEDRHGYLLPVDGDPSQVYLTGYNVRTLVQNMDKVPARSVTIALDSCFSGLSQAGSLVKAASAISIRPRIAGYGNVTLLTAGKGNQMASWDTGANLGLFTRHFIEGMLGAADERSGDGNGSIEFAELKRYL